MFPLRGRWWQLVLGEARFPPISCQNCQSDLTFEWAELSTHSKAGKSAGTRRVSELSKMETANEGEGIRTEIDLMKSNWARARGGRRRWEIRRDGWYNNAFYLSG